MTLAVRKKTNVVALQIKYDYDKWHELIRTEIREQVHRKVRMYHIAQETGLCVGTISRLVYGPTKYPRMDTIVRILTYLGYRLYAEKQD